MRADEDSSYTRTARLCYDFLLRYPAVPLFAVGTLVVYRNTVEKTQDKDKNKDHNRCDPSSSSSSSYPGGEPNATVADTLTDVLSGVWQHFFRRLPFFPGKDEGQTASPPAGSPQRCTLPVSPRAAPVRGAHQARSTGVTRASGFFST